MFRGVTSVSMRRTALSNGVAVLSRGGWVAILAAMALAGCTSFGATGPSSKEIRNASGRTVEGSLVKVIDLDQITLQRIGETDRQIPFSEIFGDVPISETIIGRGDMLTVEIWESPPAVLLGTATRVGPASALTMPSATSSRLAVPSLLVESDGTIPVPFAGNVMAAGRTPVQVSREIRARLAGKAHDPQVIVGLAQNNNTAVSVFGNVKVNGRVPLSPRGERVLEVIAGAGGVDDNVDKAVIQLSRGGRVASLPLVRLINEPSENIRLQPNDVVTALTKTLSFMALGASGKNDEIEFEATGITLSQALGRMGGLREDRANVRGVYIFRLEKPALVGVTPGDGTRLTSEGLVPVIYRVDMARADTLFLAQKFAVRDGDVIYVSTAPMSDLQRFVGLLSSLVFPVIGLTQAIP